MNRQVFFLSAVVILLLGSLCFSWITKQRKERSQADYDGHGKTPMELTDETALQIAWNSFAESPLSTNPPPVIRRDTKNTVVYLPRFRRQEEATRVFPDDWLPVWIDNATHEVIPSPHSVLTESEALQIAKSALAGRSYDVNGAIKVERNSVCFVFTFPEPPHGTPGTYLGPDFAAKVGINCETKEVLFVFVGG